MPTYYFSNPFCFISQFLVEFHQNLCKAKKLLNKKKVFKIRYKKFLRGTVNFKDIYGSASED